MAATVKILVDAHFVTAGYQGTQTFLSGLYNAMHKYHPDAELFFAATDAAALQLVFPFADEQHILLVKKRKPAILRLWLDVPALLKKHSFDFAHFQYISPVAKSNCHIIVTTHDILFNDYPEQFSLFYRISRNLLFKRSIRRAAIKTTVSDFSRKSISRHYGISENEITVLPNAAAENFGDIIGADEARHLVKQQFGIENFILFVSRIEPRKNHHLLLKKYLELRLWEQQVPLVFAGKKSIAVPAFEKLLRSLTAAQRSQVYFLSELGTTELEALYKSCRLFVYPSAGEGFGIPPLEAAVCKVSVLCSNTTAMKDFTFFEPYTFNPADEAAFTAQLKAMLSSPPSDEFISLTAAAVREKYSWKHTAAIFNQLLKEKRGAGK